MKRLEEFDESKLLVNPFAEVLRIPVTMKTATGRFVKAPDEFYDAETYPVERTPYVRIFYTPHIDIKHRVCKLTNKALRLYTYILYHLEPNKDYIQINQDHFMKLCSVKALNTFLEGKKELIRYGFITGTEYKTVFWINPQIFFPGNRLSKYSDKIENKS